MYKMLLDLCHANVQFLYIIFNFVFYILRVCYITLFYLILYLYHFMTIYNLYYLLFYILYLYKSYFFVYFDACLSLSL